jgi:hypothetical protein
MGVCSVNATALPLFPLIYLESLRHQPEISKA